MEAQYYVLWQFQAQLQVLQVIHIVQCREIDKSLQLEWYVAHHPQVKQPVF